MTTPLDISTKVIAEKVAKEIRNTLADNMLGGDKMPSSKVSEPKAPSLDWKAPIDTSGWTVDDRAVAVAKHKAPLYGVDVFGNKIYVDSVSKVEAPPKTASQVSWQEILDNPETKKTPPKEAEPVAGWLDNTLDSYLNEKPEAPKSIVQELDATIRKKMAEAAATRAAAIKTLDDLAKKDAQRHIAQYEAENRRLDDYFDNYTTPGKPISAKGTVPAEAEVLKSYYDAFTAASKVAAQQQDVTKGSIPIALDKLSDKLDNLEKQVASINAAHGAALNKASGKIHEPTFNDADLLALERMLDGFDKKNAPTIQYVQPTVDDLRKFAEILDGAQVTGMSNSPFVSPNDLHTYLEREAVMARTKSGWITEPDGTQKHYKNGVLHADGDQPAEIRPNGTNLFYKNGSLHRDGNQPAMVGIRGTAKFAVDGKYHRLGGLPAITWSKGPYRHEYWVNGEIQRATKKDGTQEWYAAGSDDREEAILHRTDGPAVIHPNNREEFWLNGNQFNTREQWLGALSRLNDMKEEALDQELIDEDPVDEYADVEEAPVTVKSKVSKTKKEKKMDKLSFAENFKANAVSAGFRVAGTQLTAAVKGAILTVMRNKGADGGAIQAFSAFLDTEFGAAMISFMIGSGLPYIPMYGENPSVARLATEMQVGGMATAGNAIIGEAMQHVLPAITQILQNLPAVDGETTSNVRVIESKEQGKLVEALETEEEESDTVETSGKTMNA